jgi:hypothetical protein
MAILRDVGESVKELLHQKISQLSDENSILFDSPADIEDTTTPKLSMFLYQIVENSHLRNVDPKPIGIDQIRYPPLALDLYYIFTPFANNRETEIIILERIMQLFYDNAVIKDEMLTVSLKESGNDKIRVIANNLSFEELNKLWERFPNKDFKLSVSYIFTPIKIPSEKPDTMIKRVMEKDIEVYTKI